MSSAEPRRRADPVITEIVRNGVIAVTEEMKTNLMRTAYNHIIYEALDFTTGLFNARGETISIGLGLPMFIRGMAETLKAARFRVDRKSSMVLLFMCLVAGEDNWSVRKRQCVRDCPSPATFRALSPSVIGTFSVNYDASSRRHHGNRNRAGHDEIAARWRAKLKTGHGSASSSCSSSSWIRASTCSRVTSLPS